MSDYIKREDALELFEMVLDSYKDSGIQNIKTMVAIAPQEFHLSEDNEIADFNFELDGWRNNLMEIESADVAPIRHGHWIYDQCDIVCSECGKAFSDEVCYMMRSDVSYHEPKHCLWCGARMDERKDDETDRR